MQTWPGTLLKKMVEAGEFSRKMETHLLLKRGIWFFLIPGQSNIKAILFLIFFLFHDANKDSQGGYVII